jgi:hypothetical protein
MVVVAEVNLAQKVEPQASLEAAAEVNLAQKVEPQASLEAAAEVYHSLMKLYPD